MSDEIKKSETQVPSKELIEDDIEDVAGGAQVDAFLKIDEAKGESESRPSDTEENLGDADGGGRTSR